MNSDLNNDFKCFKGNCPFCNEYRMFMKLHLLEQHKDKLSPENSLQYFKGQTDELAMRIAQIKALKAFVQARNNIGEQEEMKKIMEKYNGLFQNTK